MKSVSAHRLKPATKKRALAFKLDVPLLLVIISLLIFGLLMVYSASYDYSFLFYGDSTTMFKRQLIFLAVGLARHDQLDIRRLSLLAPGGSGVDGKHHLFTGLRVPG